MNIPAIFSNSVCKCSYPLEKSDMKEIGVDVIENIFFLRFKCPKCDLDGKVRFSKFERSVFDLCKQIVKEDQNENIDELSERMFELYKENIGCLHIPDWTEESFGDFNNSIGNMKE